MNRRVLVVDDDPDIRALIAVTLSKAGFETESAQDGASAMTRLRNGEFDLVVLDLMMPRMSGWQLLDLLRLEPLDHPPPVIVVTAAGRHELGELDGRVTAVLSKPFDIHDLVQTARDCVAAS